MKPLKVQGNRLLWPYDAVRNLAEVRQRPGGRRHVARRMTTAELAAELKYTRQRLQQLIVELDLDVERRPDKQGNPVLWPPKAVKALRRHRATIGAAPPPLPSTTEVARRFGVTQGYISQLTASLRPRVIRVGRLVFWPPDSVEVIRRHLEAVARPHARKGGRSSAVPKRRRVGG